MRRLLIRPGAIGDCIVSLPVLEYLQGDFTEVWIRSEIVPLVGFADVVRPLSSTGLDLFGIPDVPASANLLAELRGFDHIVSWYGANRPEFREAIAGLGVTCNFYAPLPPLDYLGHATDFFAEQVGAPRGLIPHVAVQRCQPRESVVIHPFSGSSRKNWPLESYQNLAECLNLTVDWCAGPEEKLAQAERFDSLAELGEWMSGARQYIGNDSGITHLAAALGMPVLALFGPASTCSWVPRGEQVRVLHSDPLTRLSVETVLEESNRLLGWQ